MSQAEETRKLLRTTFGEPTDHADLSAMDERILCDASTSMKEAVSTSRRIDRVANWRQIMKTKTARLAAAAAILIAAFVLTTFDGSSTAWSLEQTIAAMEQLKSIQIKGTALWGPDSDPELVNFEFRIRPPEGESPLKMRFECEKRIIVAKGDVAHECWPHERVARVKHGPGISDLKYWYQAAELTPWLTGETLENIRLLSKDWNQTVEKNANSGKEEIVVTCSYAPSNRSFLIVVDLTNKLIQRAKVWNNLNREGRPDVDAQSFTYNEGVSDEVFEVPSGMTIVNEKEIEESEALFDKGEQLFHEEGKYTEAIEVYRRVYERFPDLNVAETALMMIGLCHHRLGQREQEIEAYLKAVREYPNLKGRIESTYFYLGHAYLGVGERDKALDAFEKCLAAGQGVREPDQFPLKDARESIASITAARENQPSP